MTTKALAAGGALALCGVLSVPALATPISIIDEPFSGSTVPDGWVFNGKEGTSHTSPNNGNPKQDSDWFVSDATGSFLRLTENSWNQRTTAIYWADTFSTLVNFSISAEVRIQSGAGSRGADGMSFFWLDATSLDLDHGRADKGLGHYQGGMGEWQGAPRGTIIGDRTPCGTPSNCVMEEHFGAYNSDDGFFETPGGDAENSLRGFSFEFDHYRNAQNEQLEYNHMVRLDDWFHMDHMNVNHSGNNDDNFYEDDGWVSFELAYSAASQSFTYTYIGRDADGDPVAPTVVELTPEADQWVGFGSAYFGISAATGGQTADHDVRNLVVTQAPTPGTLALMALTPMALLAARRRRR